MMTHLLLSVVMLLAPHGDAGRYEDNLTLLTGSVVELQFINPHSLIVMDVTDDSAKPVRWRAELGAPAGLIKQIGWNKTPLKPGDKITVVGRRVKSGAPYINLTEMAKIVMAD